MTIRERFLNHITVKFSSLLKKHEDPIAQAEYALQKLKDLKRKTYDSLVSTVALITTISQDIESRSKYIEDCQKKVTDLLIKAKKENVDKDAAESLAKQLLANIVRFTKDLDSLKESCKKYEQLQSKLELKMSKIKQKISDYEFELASLKSRKNVASTLKAINKSMSSADSESFVSLIEDATSLVRSEEALAEAYEKVNSKSLDEQLDEFLGSSEEAEVENMLQQIKDSLEVKEG